MTTIWGSNAFPGKAAMNPKRGRDAKGRATTAGRTGSEIANSCWTATLECAKICARNDLYNACIALHDDAMVELSNK